MFNHAPDNYVCPFCLLVQGIENDYVESKQSDIVYKDKEITIVICASWKEKNHGHVMILPNTHIENIYELPIELSNKVHAFEIEVAKAFKEIYKCDGVSSRQHNEPAGNQSVFHYHLHVFPRYEGDNMYRSYSRRADVKDRAEYALKLRNHFMNI